MQPERIAYGVYRLRTLLVNVYFITGSEELHSPWTLIDTGLPGYSGAIRRAAERTFGGPPSQILLTHGHFDHVGGLPTLAERWGVPVYAHPLEMPYLTGRSQYPPPDPTAGGGALAWTSAVNPRGPIDLGARVRILPEGGAVPGLPDWLWLRTPGHTPGHVSLYREGDGTLIAGDAVVTTKQESLLNVIAQREMVWRPPAYFTPDWIAARRSVQTIAALNPEVLATGHGRVLRGESMRRALRNLANGFDEAMPSSGRYVPYPAVFDETGVVHVPPRVHMTPAARAVLGAAALAAGLTLIAARRRAVASRALR
jgi:glyoxylase-like metal-dependent hydrolase (beta-lactamase superfamily II)